MFNKHYNLMDSLGNMPLNLRQRLLYSLVGSMNFSIIGAADNIVVTATKDGVDFKHVTVRDIEVMMEDPDAGGTRLRELRALNHFAGTLRSMLQENLALATDVAEVDKPGSVQNALKRATGQQQVGGIDPEGLAILKTLNLVPTQEEIEAGKRERQARFQAVADARAKRIGEIEWVIDHVLVFAHEDDANRPTTAEMNGADAAEADGDISGWCGLSIEQREVIVDKAIQALGKLFLTAKNEILFGSSRRDKLSASDLILIPDCIKQIQSEAYISAAEAVKRATKRVDAQGNELTGKGKKAKAKKAQPKKRVPKEALADAFKANDAPEAA